METVGVLPSQSVKWHCFVTSIVSVLVFVRGIVTSREVIINAREKNVVETLLQVVYKGHSLGKTDVFDWFLFKKKPLKINSAPEVLNRSNRRKRILILLLDCRQTTDVLGLY